MKKSGSSSNKKRATKKNKKQKEKAKVIDVCPECKVREGDNSKKELYKCPHCGRYFCEKHLPPRLAFFSNNAVHEFLRKTTDYKVKKKIEEDIRREDGHPDWPWTEKYFEEIEKMREENRNALGKILGKPREPEKIEYYDTIWRHESKTITPPSKKRAGLIIFVVAVVLGIYTISHFIGIPDISHLFGSEYPNQIPEERITVIIHNDTIDTENTTNLTNTRKNYELICQEKAIEYLKNLVNMTEPLNITLIEMRKFSSPEDAENFAKDRILPLSYHIICKTKLEGLISRPVKIPETILTMIYNINFTEPKKICLPKGCTTRREFNEVVYCGDKGDLLEKGRSDICY